ncbi:vesicle transport protein GOT1A-like isoform X2 [Narcine bancroftii]
MGFGVFFLLFGIILYFDRVLLGFGNILFIFGIPFIAGLQNTFRFFYQRQKLKGSSFFLGGILLVLLRWPGVGMLCESYGFYLLFKSTLPLMTEFIATIPVPRFIFTSLGFNTSKHNSHLKIGANSCYYHQERGLGATGLSPADSETAATPPPSDSSKINPIMDFLKDSYFCTLLMIFLCIAPSVGLHFFICLSVHIVFGFLLHYQ